eukprot:g13520.t4
MRIVQLLQLTVCVILCAAVNGADGRRKKHDKSALVHPLDARDEDRKVSAASPDLMQRHRDLQEESDEFCIDGVPGILERNACCPSSCGECGGDNCSDRDGGDEFSGRQACCRGAVLSLGRVCSATVGAPCVITAVCDVNNPHWIGDGECDHDEYNTEACGWDGGDCCFCSCEDALYECRDSDFTECQDPDAQTCGVCDESVCEGTDLPFLNNDGDPCDGATCTAAECCGAEFVCNVSNPGYIGDGECDHGGYNTEACGWDGGDCCFCSCGDAQNECRDSDFPDCRDPDAQTCGVCDESVCEGTDLPFLNNDGDPCDGATCTAAECCGAEFVCDVARPEWVGDGYCDWDGGDYNTEACGWDGGDCCVCSCQDGDEECGVNGFYCEDPDFVACGPTCDGGIPGIQSGDVCCLSTCGECRGSGCSSRQGGDNYSGEEACCNGGVHSLGRICSAEVGAPCVFAEGPTCDGGIPGIQTGDVCCLSSCGECRGSGCSSRDGGDSYTGEEACCNAGVHSLGRICSAEVGAPCVFAEDATPSPTTPAPTTLAITPAPTVPGSTCDGGIPGIQNGDVCCLASCGECRGSGCSSRDGGDNYSGEEACCNGGVHSLGRICSAEVGAPCVFAEDATPSPTTPAPSTPTPSTPTPTTPAPVMEGPTCSNGLPGYEANDVCCPLSCGECGGSGCSSRGDGCCTSDVKDSGDLCSVTMAAPCNIDGDSADGDAVCSNGLPGYEANDVCCPLSCGECGGSGCSSRGDGCCTSDVKDSGDLCSVTMAAPCNIDGDSVDADEACTAGVPGILANGACCPTSCESCGGDGCSGRNGGDGFSGSEACCISGVVSLGRTCSADVAAPCVVA